MRQIKLTVQAGITIYASTGRIGYGQSDRMSSWNFYKAICGSRLHLLDKNYYYNVATYTMDYDPKYIYTYAYEPEQSWTTYTGDLRGDTYIQEDYVFTDERYFRVCLKRKDGAAFSMNEAAAIHEILSFTMPECSDNREKEYFQSEITRTVRQISEQRRKSSVLFAVLTDSHYTVNGTWPDTVQNIKAVHDQVSFDAIIHLGDWTDGMIPAKITRQYVSQMIEDLQQCQVPIYAVLGNHDANYFHNNPESFSVAAQCELYQNHNERKRLNFFQQPFYYIDDYQAKLRCLFLTSFDDQETIRYGFSLEEVLWVKQVLEKTPRSYSVIIFSHVAPLATLDFWADKIRNGEEMLDVLETYNRQGSMMAYIHGHTHADSCYQGVSFPILSIGCNKCEYMLDKKNPEMITPKRTIHTVTQDLWDAMLINSKAHTIDFIRFGAGEDRHLFIPVT